MLKRICVLFAISLLPASVLAATWTEDCPQVEVNSPFTYKRIWTTDDAWVRQPINANQPILMSCGNWKVMGQEMVCYYGAYKVTYDYAIKKSIPEGASCDRAATCQFKCTSTTVPQKLAPKLKVPRQVIPQ